MHLAGSDRVRSMIAIAPDGLGTPWNACRAMPRCWPGGSDDDADSRRRAAQRDSGGNVGVLRRKLQSALEARAGRSPPVAHRWGRLTGLRRRGWVAMFDIPTTLHKINKPALFIQGTADPLTTQHLAVRRADSGRPVAQVFLARSACRSPTTRRLSWAHAGLPQAGVGYRVRRLMGGVPARRP